MREAYSVQGPGVVRSPAWRCSLHGLFFDVSDGATFHASDLLAVFSDPTVAELVREELAGAKRRRSGIDAGVFVVREVPAYLAVSESRVRGIAKEILDAQFPRVPG